MKRPNLKSKFLDPLKTQGIDKRDFFLLEDFRFYSRVIKDVIVVPKGFTCDGTSDLLKDDSEPCGVIHDYCYRAPNHKVNVERDGIIYQVYIAKSTADLIFLEAMKVWKVKAWKRWMKYIGVVVGGGSSYDTGPSRYRIINF